MEDTDDVSSLIYVGRFLDTFHDVINSVVYPELDQEERARAAERCNIDQELQDLTPFLSDPMMSHLTNLREGNIGKKRKRGSELTEEVKEEDPPVIEKQDDDPENLLDSPLPSPLHSAHPSPSPVPFTTLERITEPSNSFQPPPSSSSSSPALPPLPNLPLLSLATVAATAMASPSSSSAPGGAVPKTEAQQLKEKIGMFEKTMKGSRLMALREAEKREPEKRSSKPKDLDLVSSEDVVPQQHEEPIAFAPIPLPEVVLSVGLYRPGRLTKIQEYLVLGSQSLTVLRDKLYCLSDLMLDGPETKSGYFFIENVFYNDFRDENSLDYSENVIEWVSRNKRYAHKSFGVFTKADMTSTTFRDLCIRLNFPYYYVHQGNCEHILMFKEIRLLHPQDDQNFNAYPLQIFQNRVRRRKCRVCELFPAKYATIGDKLASENPCFFCERCYERLHYDSKGNLLYEDFEVYDYSHEW